MASDDPDPAGRAPLVEALLTKQALWLFERCQKATASRPGLDPGDVYQEAVRRLMLSRTEVDADHDHVRAFLGRCVDWAVLDLADDRVRQGGVAVSEAEFDAALENQVADDPEDPGAGPLMQRDLLDRIGLTTNQADTVLKEASHPDLTWKEFALLVGRSHAAVRQDRKRALDKIENWLGLDDDERRAYAAHRRTGSFTATAAALRMPESRCRALLRSADRKIRLRLNPREEGRS